MENKIKYYLSFMEFLRQTSDNKINRIELIPLTSDQHLVISPPEGDFSSSQIGNAIFDGIYFTVQSPELTEEGKDTEAGFLWVKEFSFKFPTHTQRNSIISKIRMLKTIRLHFCNGHFIDLGRNDYHQNTPINSRISTIADFTAIAWTINSIFPFQFQS